jgi:ParB family transcriptional regulator, chromosome partitioning protein
MANAKITLSASRDIPFNKLVLSQSNVRRVKAGVSIEELAEDIVRRSLLQSLSVGRCWTAMGRRPECSRCRPAAADSGPSSCWSSRNA